MSAKWTRTGKTRLFMVSRWFRRPLVGLQVEFVDESYYDNGRRPTTWESAGLSDLTATKGIDPRGPQSSIRYRAHKTGVWRNLWLVMQVCDDPDANKWRDARVEDLGDFAQVSCESYKSAKN